jgi:hypothetical protein
MSDPAACPTCGAPKQTGLAMCKFCKTPFVQNTQTQAVPCPKCPTLNEWGAQKCASCQTWVVVKCVFCGGLSPHHISACLSCHEAFAGAPERLAQRQQAQASQRNMQIAGTVGNVAASFLGAVAGSALTGGYSNHGYGHRHHHNNDGGFFSNDSGYDNSNNASYDNSDPNAGGSSGSSDGGSGGGILDSLFGGSSDSSSDNSSSSYDSGDSGSSDGGGGGGLLDDLMGGGGSSDDS